MPVKPEAIVTPNDQELLADPNYRRAVILLVERWAAIVQRKHFREGAGGSLGGSVNDGND